MPGGFSPERHAACHLRVSASSHTQRAGRVGIRPRVGPLLARDPANGWHLPTRHGWLTRGGPGARHTGHPCWGALILSPGPGVRVPPRGCPSGVRGHVLRRVTCGVTFGGEPPSRASDAPPGHIEHAGGTLPPRPCGMIGPRPRFLLLVPWPAARGASPPVPLREYSMNRASWVGAPAGHTGPLSPFSRLHCHRRRLSGRPHFPRSRCRWSGSITLGTA
jgi:hypothetical protein